MSDAFWTAAGLVLVAAIGGFNLWNGQRIHKAVNSTATKMAEDLKAEQDKNSTLSARVSQLEERAEGKQVAQDLKDAKGTE